MAGWVDGIKKSPGSDEGTVRRIRERGNQGSERALSGLGHYLQVGKPVVTKIAGA